MKSHIAFANVALRASSGKKAEGGRNEPHYPKAALCPPMADQKPASLHSLWACWRQSHHGTRMGAPEMYMSPTDAVQPITAAEALEEAADAIARKRAPFNWASENADRYRAQDEAFTVAESVVRALAARVREQNALCAQECYATTEEERCVDCPAAQSARAVAWRWRWKHYGDWRYTGTEPQGGDAIDVEPLYAATLPQPETCNMDVIVSHERYEQLLAFEAAAQPQVQEGWPTPQMSKRGLEVMRQSPISEGGVNSVFLAMLAVAPKSAAQRQQTRWRDQVEGAVWGTDHSAHRQLARDMAAILDRLPQSESAAQSASVPPYAEIAGAVARGWCSPTNAHKPMDTNLAMAITVEVDRLLRALASGNAKEGKDG